MTDLFDCMNADNEIIAHAQCPKCGKPSDYDNWEWAGVDDDCLACPRCCEEIDIDDIEWVAGEGPKEWLSCPECKHGHAFDIGYLVPDLDIWCDRCRKRNTVSEWVRPKQKCLLCAGKGEMQ